MRGNSEQQEAGVALDKLKWLMVLVLVVVIVWGNYYFTQPDAIYPINYIVRIITVVVLSLAALGLAAMTKRGKQIILFSKESRLELRKVVWSTRKETIHTTILIAIITVITSLFLWGLDSIMIRLVTFLTLLGH